MKTDGALFPKTSFGFTSSPLQIGGVVQVLNYDTSSAVK